MGLLAPGRMGGATVWRFRKVRATDIDRNCAAPDLTSLPGAYHSRPLVNIVATGTFGLNNPELSLLSTNSTTVLLDVNHLVQFPQSGGTLVASYTVSVLDQLQST